MKTSIIFHSVCGNTYLMAKAFYESCLKQGKDAALYRVEDDDLKKWADMFPNAKEYLEEILRVPVATPKNMLESDHIILGSPTYFGNVSGEMKSYMDMAAEFWLDAKLAGKKLTAFTSSGDVEGGGHSCLQAINTFGQHMGMIVMSVPSNLLPDESFPAYGIIHYSGGLADQRPGKKVLDAIERYTQLYIK